LGDRDDKSAPSGLRPIRLHRFILGYGSVYTFATVAPALATLAVTPILTRILGDEYGMVALGISIYHFASILLAIGLPSIVTRNAIVERSGLAGAAGLVVAGSGLALLGGLVISATVPLWGNRLAGSGDGLALVAPTCSSVGLAMVLLVQAYLRAVNRAVHFVVVAFAAALLAPAVALLGVVSLAPSSLVYLWTLAAAHLIVGVVAVLSIVVLTVPRLVRKELVRACRMGLPTLAHQVSTPLMTTALVVIAAIVLGQRGAGQVQLAIFIGASPMLILGALNSAWAPMVYRTDQSERVGVLTESTRLVSAVVMVMIAGFLAIIDTFVAFLAGPLVQARELSDASIVVALGIVFFVVYLSNVHLVFYSGRTGLLGLTTPLCLVVAVGAVAVLLLVLPGASLVLFAIAFPVFYLGLAASSFYLRSRTGLSGARFVPALPYLAVTATLIALHLLAHPPVWLGWIAFALTAGSASAIEGFRLRPPSRRTGGRGTRARRDGS
jgi:O-antigen/teichoic acid export membrane protein